MIPQTHTYGVVQNLPANSFTRAGYAFTGWNTAANGSGTAYTDGESVSNLTSTQGASITLYAQWQTILTSTGDIAVYLGGASGGASAATPIPLAMELQLTAANWNAILTAINTANKFVSLYLTGCTKAAEITGGGLRSTGDFDPVYGTTTGKAKIVNLTLPTLATGIVAGTASNDATFTSFTALKTVRGAGVTSIGNYAFCLRNVLTSASFPAAESIGDEAFSQCTALASVSFPQAASIGNYAFQGCSALASVTLGASPPTLGTGICSNISTARTVTVKIPASATSAYGVPNLPGTNFDNASTTDSWGRAFNGLGWDGTNYLSGTVNTNITLRFETY
jgi:uncharacterized repeat protein (TIGR02543 family)